MRALVYRKGTVLLESIDDENVQFVEVQTIVIHEQAKYLYCCRLNILFFDAHRNAFRVDRSESVSVIRITDLFYRWPQVVHHQGDRYFVMLHNADDVWSLH